MRITVETHVRASPDTVWKVWTTPAQIMQWNTASDDWHTTAAEVDLRPGGPFRSRMEARDGSAGFDFEGTYTLVDAPGRIEAVFGGRSLVVEFLPDADGVTVRETFEAETSHPPEVQRAGWQAILDRFARQAEAFSG